MKIVFCKFHGPLCYDVVWDYEFNGHVVKSDVCLNEIMRCTWREDYRDTEKEKIDIRLNIKTVDISYMFLGI